MLNYQRVQHSNFSIFLGVAIGELCRFSQEYADVHPTLLGCVCTDNDIIHSFYWDNLPQVSLDWEIAYFVALVTRLSLSHLYPLHLGIPAAKTNESFPRKISQAASASEVIQSKPRDQGPFLKSFHAMVQSILALANRYLEGQFSMRYFLRQQSL